MDLQLNWVDIVILAALVFFILGALGRSLLWEVFDLLSFFLAAIISFSFYNIPAKFFELEFGIPHGLSLVLGFMSAWFLAEVIFYLLVRLLLPKFPKIMLPYSKTLSVFPAVLRGLIFVAIILVIVATFPIQPTVKKAVLDSRLGSQILKRAYALEAPVKQVFGGLVNDSLTFLTIKPKTEERVNLGFQTADFSTDPQEESNMIKLVNNERTLRGLKLLEFDAGLKEVGRGHSADMFKRGYFSHYSPEGLTVANRVLNAGIDFLIVGENLAYAPSLELAFRGLMNSEGHRENMLSSDYGKIGIGVMDGGIYGKMYTQVFTNR